MRCNMKYQQDFLWFTYFGISWTKANKDKDKAIESCCNRAYRDLCRTLKYTYSMSKLNSMTKDKRESYKNKKDDFKKAVTDMLTNRCKELLKGTEKFDKWHKKICEDIICSAGKKGELFKSLPTYGHAQKWVNMTLKNMLVMGLWDMDDLKQYLHIPLDSYIFKEAKDKLKVECPFKNWSEDDGIPFDDAAYNKYLTYQKAINQAAQKKYHKTAIDWEGEAWIKQAEAKNEDD